MDNEKLKEMLEKLANRETWIGGGDFNPMEFSGGNYDDCYSRGMDDGETLLAKLLLEQLFGQPK